ncbi:hypothetical protein, partial [Bacillus pumilus]|uniref:hypothetical protein n=1 Tax=Bacillus pumilus TaxID=1408 RepID=UPI001C92DE92
MDQVMCVYKEVGFERVVEGVGEGGERDEEVEVEGLEVKKMRGVRREMVRDDGGVVVEEVGDNYQEGDLMGFG